jgi:hypothetical protein
MFVGGDAPLRWDLSARIEGINRPVSRERVAINGELFAQPDAACPVLDSLNQFMVDAGIGWDRETWPWYRIQQHDSDSFDWRLPDSVMVFADTHNIKVFPVLYWTPHWACTHFVHHPDGTVDSSLVCPPRNLAESVTDSLQPDSINRNQFWGRFVYEAIQRYGPDGTFWSEHSGLPYLPIIDWEVWNEPHYLTYGFVTPDAGSGFRAPQSLPESIALQETLYARLCDVAIEAASLTHKTARMMVGVFGPPVDSCPVPGNNSRSVKGAEWLNAYYRIRHQTATGGVSFHPYQPPPAGEGLNPDTLARDIDTVRQLMRAHGEGDKPLWATEIGFSQETGPEAEARATLSLPGTYLLSLCGTPTNVLDKVFWYDFCTPPYSNSPSALYHLHGDWSIERLPCTYAFKQMTGELLGKRINGRVLSDDSATDAKSRFYELEDTATGKKTWVGWRNYAPGAAAVAMRIPTRTDQLDIVPLARSADADRLNRTAAARSDGWLGLPLDTIPVYVHETGTVTRPDLAVDSVWTEESPSAKVTLHARVKNVGNRQFVSSGKKGSCLRFAIDGATVNPMSEPKELAPGGTAIIESAPVSPDRTIAHLASATANPDEEVMELNFDNNTRYCQLSTR